MCVAVFLQEELSKVSGSTFLNHSEMTAEFNQLSRDIHSGFIDDPEYFYGEKGGETLFLRTGCRRMSDEEFSRVMDLVNTGGLPLSASCHAKFGGFIFVLSNPTSSDELEILFGFEVEQVPIKNRTGLRTRYESRENRELLGAYAEGRNVDRLLPYLDTSHSNSWEE